MSSTDTTPTTRVDDELQGLDALETVTTQRVPLTQVLREKVLPPLLGVLLVLAVWQLVYSLHVTPSYKLPSPLDVWHSLTDLWYQGTLFSIIWTSLWRGISGFLAAVVIGTPIGLIVARVKFVRAAVGPVLSGLQSLPSVAWVPAAVIWLGINDQAMYAVILLGAVPSIANGLISGIDQVPPLFLRAGRTLGARGLTSARHVLLPAALPGYLAGLKQGWAFSWRSLMAAELIASSPTSASAWAATWRTSATPPTCRACCSASSSSWWSAWRSICWSSRRSRTACCAAAACCRAGTDASRAPPDRPRQPRPPARGDGRRPGPRGAGAAARPGGGHRLPGPLRAAPVTGGGAARRAGGGGAAAAQPRLPRQARHPGRAAPAGAAGMPVADVLGPAPLLLAALERRLAQAGLDLAQRASTGVVLAAAGSSDPAADAATRALAADWQRRGGWGAVAVAYASATGPRVPDALAELRARGVQRTAVAPYLLAPGVLPDRIAAAATEAGADVLAPVLGAAPEIARLLLARYEQAGMPAAIAAA